MTIPTQDKIADFDKDAFRLAVRRAVQTGKVVVFWNTPSRLFVADCFYPGCTEGQLDSDFLHPYLWELEFGFHQREGRM